MAGTDGEGKRVSGEAAPVIIDTNAKGTVAVRLDGRDITLSVDLTDSVAYQKVADVFREYMKMRSTFTELKGRKDDDGLKSADIVLSSIGAMIGKFRDAVEAATGKEAFSATFGAVVDRIPVSAWGNLVGRIVMLYADYFHGVNTSDEGEL